MVPPPLAHAADRSCGYSSIVVSSACVTRVLGALILLGILVTSLNLTGQSQVRSLNPTDQSHSAAVNGRETLQLHRRVVRLRHKSFGLSPARSMLDTLRSVLNILRSMSDTLGSMLDILRSLSDTLRSMLDTLRGVLDTPRSVLNTHACTQKQY